MTERWVINASPIIVLAKIDSTWLLEELADKIIVPQAVVDEINAGPVNDPARKFLATSPWPIANVRVNSVVQAWDLGSGETSVLSYALVHGGWKAVIDDAAARKCAHTLNIPTMGTLGVILKARKKGLIPEAAPLLKAIKSHGFRLSDHIISQALKMFLDEDWP